MRLLSSLGAAVAILATAAPAHAWRFDDHAEVYGYAQVWATVWEQMEDMKGLYQHPSKDEAADGLSGFSLAKARLGARLKHDGWGLAAHTQIKLEQGFALLDLDFSWSPARWLEVHLGQFKVPGAAEALAPDQDLDFTLRTDLATALADFSLAKSQHPVSLLYGSTSNLRDVGLALKGTVDGRWLGARYFLMVGNGLGANMFFGGLTKREYFITNEGQFYWGGRLELGIAGVATLGAFGSYNRHDNIVFNSGRAVYDLNRRMVGGDVQLAVPLTGLRLSALGGGGQIRDDFNGDGKVDLRYSGWSLAAAWDLFPLLGRLLELRLPEGHRAELAVRYEETSQELDETGLPIRRVRTTLGASYVAGPYAKVQVQYVLRHTDDPAAVAPDLANDLFLVCVQAAF